jgi:hypothetical protein
VVLRYYFGVVVVGVRLKEWIATGVAENSLQIIERRARVVQQSRSKCGSGEANAEEAVTTAI